MLGGAGQGWNKNENNGIYWYNSGTKFHKIGYIAYNYNYNYDDTIHLCVEVRTQVGSGKSMKMLGNMSCTNLETF